LTTDFLLDTRFFTTVVSLYDNRGVVAELRERAVWGPSFEVSLILDNTFL
jgi:hypothetical protein